jgi:hypothetical protein
MRCHRFHGFPYEFSCFFLVRVLLWAIECTRWFIGRCVVLCVCKLGSSLAGGKSKLGGGGWCKCKCVGRQKGSCGSCLIRVTSMYSTKSIRMFERMT